MRARPVILAAVAATAIACAGCDSLVGLETPIVLQGHDAAPAGPAMPEGGDGPSAPAQEGGPDAPPDAPLADAGNPDGCTPCEGGCVDTATDDGNCGACGHSCLGAGCGAGRCQPHLVASGQPTSLSVDDAGVYFTDGVSGNVLRCPIAGCGDGGPTTLFEGADAGFPYGGYMAAYGSVTGLRVSDGELYLAENSGSQGIIFACPASTGCTGAPSDIFASEAAYATNPPCNYQCQVGALAVDHDNVYWTATIDSSVHICPRSGCASPAVVAPKVTNAYTPWGIDVGGGTLYFGYGGPVATPTYGVGACVAASCTCTGVECVLPSPTAGSPPQMLAVAAGKSGAYWTSSASNEIVANPLGAHSPAAASVLEKVTEPGKAVVDDRGVLYFTAPKAAGEPAVVYSCPLSGCDGNKTVVLSAASGGVGEIAVDSQRIYAVVGTTTNQPASAGSSGSPAPPPPPQGTSILWVAK